MTLTRRSFAQLLGVGTAVAALPDLLAKPNAPVLLNSNENPYGPSPAAVQAIRDAIATSFRYPDEVETALGETVAKLHGVTTSEILLTNGSSDVLRLAAFASLAGGRKLVTGIPTFEALWFHARGSNSDIARIPLTASHAHDLDKMLEAARGAGLVYLCNPNNPTATITPKAAVRAFLDAVPPETLVLVDEAYHHYADSADYESVIPLVAKKTNLIVARTFSKIYAMAGLRCGYAVAQKPLIDKLQAQQSFNVMNVMACVAARASLLDSEHAAASKKKNRETRAWIIGELEKLGYRSLPSEANFFMVDVRTEVRPLIDAMRERGVRIGRRFAPMPTHLRVTVGTREEMQRFLEVFAATVR